VFLPVRPPVFKCFTPVDGGIVHGNNRLFCDRVTKCIKTGNYHARVDRLFKHRGMQIIVAIEEPSHIDPTIAHGRQLDDALWRLPSIGNRGIKRQARFIKLIEINLALVLLSLQGGEFPLTARKGLRIAETLERLSHPFPSKTRLFGQTFERRETEALLGFVG